MSDPTNPTHYHTKIQPLDYIEANGMNFHEGNVIKYVTRWRNRGGVEDLKKARVYLDRLIKMEEEAMTKPKVQVKTYHYAQTDEWMYGLGRLHGCVVAVGGCAVIMGMAIVVAAILSGCATKATLSLDETMADGGTFRLAYSARGDGLVNQSVEYNGEGPDPWRLAVNSDADIESPAQLALAVGTADMLAALPGIIEEMLPALDLLTSTGAAQAPGMIRGVIEAVLRDRLAGIVEGLRGVTPAAE